MNCHSGTFTNNMLSAMLGVNDSNKFLSFIKHLEQTSVLFAWIIYLNPHNNLQFQSLGLNQNLGVFGHTEE